LGQLFVITPLRRRRLAVLGRGRVHLPAGNLSRPAILIATGQLPFIGAGGFLSGSLSARSAPLPMARHVRAVVPGIPLIAGSAFVLLSGSLSLSFLGAVIAAVIVLAHAESPVKHSGPSAGLRARNVLIPA